MGRQPIRASRLSHRRPAGARDPDIDFNQDVDYRRLIEYKGDIAIVRFPFSRDIVTMVKNCGGRWQPMEKVWTVPSNEPMLRELVKAHGFETIGTPPEPE